MPAHSDGARLVQLLEPLARFGISGQRLRVAALLKSGSSKLALADCDRPVVTELFRAADTLFVGRRSFVEPAKVVNVYGIVTVSKATSLVAFPAALFTTTLYGPLSLV